ncbi:hypothetical protein QQG55_39490 [Brugia pahangi]|uniref:PAZ domain-containing protein n=1 Tax=Brugia pahangi TaxID=6280 RepID=A0A0N4T010_BRUPA|nr:unnamed protein product [Brugia pahangi]
MPIGRFLALLMLHKRRLQQEYTDMCPSRSLQGGSSHVVPVSLKSYTLTKTGDFIPCININEYSKYCPSVVTVYNSHYFPNDQLISLTFPLLLFPEPYNYE